MRKFSQFLGDRRGNVAIMSAIMMVSLMGIAGLVTEYGNGLLNHMQDQRVADAAAMGGATVYNSTGSVSAMTAAANNVVTLSGISTSTVSASLVSSPSGDGNQAVEVTVHSSVPLLFSRLINPSTTNAGLAVSVTSYAELKSNAQGCVIALYQSGGGVTLSNGTALTASQCAIASDNTVSVPCGTTMTTANVDYYSSTVPSEPCNGIQPPSGSTLSVANTLTSDPLAGTSEITTATSRLSTVESLTSPAAPAGPSFNSAQNVVFQNAANASVTTTELADDGCSGTLSGTTWTVTCPGSGPYHFGAIALASGISAVFNTSGNYQDIYYFGGPISNTGNSLTFGPGTFNLREGLCTSAGSTTSFGSTSHGSTYNIGASSTCYSGTCPQTNFSICNLGTSLTFLGTAPFTMAGGVYNASGASLTMTASSFSAGALTSTCGNTTGYSICQLGNPLTINGPTAFSLHGGVFGGNYDTMTLGSGTGNSFNFGTAGTGDSLWMAGSAKVTLGDATGQPFAFAGNINMGSGVASGTCLSIGAAPEHDINGDMKTAAGLTLGSGIYTVAKYVALGASYAGDTTCNGSDVGISGNSVTFVVGGTSNYASNCDGVAATAFCIASGYSNVALTAPGSGSTQGLLVVGPTSSGTTAPAAMAEGSSNTSFSGVLYLPYGAISLNGTSSIGNGSGQCLMFIGSQVTLSGGSPRTSACNIPGSNFNNAQFTVALVQ